MIFGDEDQEYVSDSENFKINSLGTALDIEPKLEDVFENYRTGEFEWDENSGEFVEI